MLDLSIIIVNYNVKEYVISCIESIYKHISSNLRFEIIIVDNNSKDGSVEYLKKRYKNIILIENQKNVGFSPAVNQAAKMSFGKFLFLLNPDTVLIEDSFSKLMKTANNNEKFGAVGPRILSTNKENLNSFWRFPNIHSTILSLVHLDSLNFKKNYNDLNTNDIISVDSISGGALLVEKKVFYKVGGLNENLFWMEDIDFCFKLKKIGYKIFHNPKTEIIHHVGKSSKKNYKVAISNQLLSKVKFFKLHHSALSSIIVLLIVLNVSIIKSFILLFLAPFSSVSYKKLIAYLHTIRSLAKL